MNNTAGYLQTPEGDIMPPLHLLSEDKDKYKYTEHKIWGTPIKGLLVWERKLYLDARGSYQELSRTEQIEKVLERKIDIQQVSNSLNEPYGVLRGVHAEEMDKLITPWRGKFFIAIVDVRTESPTFGKYVTFTIDQTNPRKPKKTFVVSRGLGNSFETIWLEGEQKGEVAEYLYQITEAYKTSEGKKQIRYNDPDVGIPWPVEPTIMSEQDAYNNPSLRDLFPNKFHDK